MGRCTSNTCQRLTVLGAGLSLLIDLNFNHRGTCFIPLAGERTENTEGSILLGWKEATEAAFGREIDSFYSPRKEDLCVLCASVVKD